MDQESNEVKLTDKEHTDFQGTSKLMKFSPCDEEAEILQGSTVELCVCHKSDATTCHKKRLVLNKEEGKLEVTETLNENHKRIEAHFYTKEEMLIRTIKRVNDHHQHVHVINNELKILQKSKQYAKQNIQKYNHSVHQSLHDDYHTYLFEVEK